MRVEEEGIEEGEKEMDRRKSLKEREQMEKRDVDVAGGRDRRAEYVRESERKRYEDR